MISSMKDSLSMARVSLHGLSYSKTRGFTTGGKTLKQPALSQTRLTKSRGFADPQRRATDTAIKLIK